MAEVCDCKGYENMTYGTYSCCVDDVYDKKKLSPNKAQRLKKVLEFIKTMKKGFDKFMKESGMGIVALYKAIINRDFYKLLHALRFNISQILKAIGSVQKLIAGGLLYVLNEIAGGNLQEKLRSGSLRVNDLIQKYPILAKVSKYALAGLLIWMWTRMTFIGDFEFDFDLSIAFDALSGSYTLVHLLGSSEGLQFITLFFTGQFAGLSFDWMAGTPVLIVVMLLYTTSKHNPQLQTKIKRWIKTKSRKISVGKLKTIKTIQRS